MMPIQDLNPTRRFPVLTYVLIAINAIVFIWQLSFPPDQLEQIFRSLAVVPANATELGWFAPETMVDILRSMFFHGGWAHILGNMLYLYLFGDNMEDRLGMIPFAILYFVSGYVAAYTQIAIDPTSTIPMVGASGAIAGVLGGYLIMFPGVKVRGIIPLGRVSSIAEWPALYVLGMWFVLQLVSGFGALGAPSATGGGVAFFAHIGGFVAGIIITFVFMRLVPQPPVPERQQMLYQRAQRYNY